MEKDEEWPAPTPKSSEESERWYRNLVEREYATSGHQKFVRYLDAVLNTDEYQKLIVKWRKKYGMPADGFLPMDDKANDYVGYIFPVFAWKATPEEQKALYKEMKRFCMKHHLHYFDVRSVIDMHLFYNQPFDPKSMVYELGAFNLCRFADLANEAVEPFGKDFRDSDNMAYPLAIRFSPYASLRDIVAFVKATYAEQIAPQQKQYKDASVKLGSLRRRKDNIKERNAFIYKNRDLPRRKIMQLVHERFGELLDYGHVGKIISLEERGRKQV